MLSVEINIEHVFNLVNQRTLYIADQVDAAIGEAMIDKIPLTEDERDMFKTLLRDASVKILDVLTPIIGVIDTPFLIDEEAGIISYAIDDTKHHNPSLLETLLSGHILNGLTTYVVKEWLRIKGLTQTFYMSEQTKWTEILEDIRRFAKQKTSKIPYRMY